MVCRRYGRRVESFLQRARITSNKPLKGKNSPGGNGRASAWPLGRGPTPVGVLEIASKSKLDEKTRSWLELVLRYAEVALESSERRSAVIELSTIVEATKRLNSTLDLAELLNIILGLTTRYSGAERGTVFLVDRDKQEIWSLVGSVSSSMKSGCRSPRELRAG